MEKSLSVALRKAAETFGTPLYIYDQAALVQRCRALMRAVAYPKKKLLYAIKANSNSAVARAIIGTGFGVDCVSIGEVLLAQKLGAKTILYTSNNVADWEFDEAVKLASQSRRGREMWLNCDSLQRLNCLPEGAACFVRINGPVGGGHHEHVITCGPESKFGIPWEQTPELLKIARRRKVKIAGVHQHIGSGIRDVAKFGEALDVLLRVLRRHTFPDLEYVNFGGGIGVPYRPAERPMDLKKFGAMLAARFTAFCKGQGRELTLMLEPGRYPVAECGYLVVRATTIKETPYHKTFAGVDSGFNHLVRPTMYGSYHHITNLSNPRGGPRPYFVAGYVCESGDIFTRADGEENRAAARTLPEIRRGDLLAIHNAGAYGYCMASEYNLRPRPAEVMLAGGRSTLIRRAKSPRELVEENF